MDFELRRGTTAAALASGSRACRHWDALKALAAGTPDVDDLRLLTGIIGVEPSGQARQIPRRLLPPTNRYRPDPPQSSEYPSAEHSTAQAWPHRAHHGRHRGTVSDCDEVPLPVHCFCRLGDRTNNV